MTQLPETRRPRRLSIEVTDEMRHYLYRAEVRSRKRARDAGLPYTLKTGYAIDLFIKQGGRCKISDVPFATTPKFNTYVDRPLLPSFDQIKPGRGYIPSNVRLVTMWCNFAMNAWGKSFLVEMARAVTAAATAYQADTR